MRRDGLGRARARSALDVGARGEAAAARALRRRGYRVLERNARAGGGEADLVCLSPDGGTVVVVEVKSRVVGSGRGGGVRPEAGVTRAKRRALVRVAEGLMRSRVALGRDRRVGVRLDVVAVEFERRSGAGLVGSALRGPYRLSALRHYEDAVR